MLANRIGPNEIGPRLFIVELPNKLCRVRGQATGLHAASDATGSDLPRQRMPEKRLA